MRDDASYTELGSIRIHKNVIASIAAAAAQEIEGVKAPAPKRGPLELIIQSFHPDINVEISKNEEVKIDIPVIIQYGFNIPDAANKIQESIRNALEKMTNLSVKAINVNVQGIEKHKREG